MAKDGMPCGRRKCLDGCAKSALALYLSRMTSIRKDGKDHWRRKVMKRVKEGPKRRPMPRSAATSNDPTVIEDAGSDAKSSA
ncbi:unnamed protein product [Symbiodinium necroappetens]|uniref:Uncharacterized protein n=2 Tax=Symbiodinium TaxID=2949 RepID=A0A813CRD4_9DINO|nr:hypothetical protein AK812_SmicGene12635 [Symbiodinium microadriaticum]CAE7944957.1 unnamed protein product [Symbiodinium necroappetens]